MQLLGRVENVLIGRDSVSLLTTPIPEARVTLEGFEGDKHAGMTRLSDSRTPFYPRGIPIRNSRQVSIVSDEELAEVAGALGVPDVLPEWLGANLTFAGVPRLSCLPPATRLFFPDEAVLVVTEENHPCIHPGKLIQEQYPDQPGLAVRFPKVALHKRGIVAWVERPGVIRAGDAVKLDLPVQTLYSLG